VLKFAGICRKLDIPFTMSQSTASDLMGILKTVTPTIAEEILTCEKQSLTVSTYLLHYAIWPLEIILKT
jgi:hypothetical protein